LRETDNTPLTFLLPIILISGLFGGITDRFPPDNVNGIDDGLAAGLLA
jgi:hypothetical protein